MKMAEFWQRLKRIRVKLAIEQRGKVVWRLDTESSSYLLMTPKYDRAF